MKEETQRQTHEANGGSVQRLVRRPRMDIYALPGTKVIMDWPEAGWTHDQCRIKDNGLVEGQTYTVERTEVHSSSTTLYLIEFPGVAFNTVNFSEPPNVRGERRG